MVLGLRVSCASERYLAYKLCRYGSGGLTLSL